MPSVSRTLWSVIITPSPRFFSCDTRLRISFTAIGSMPANGSSSKMNLGSFASARAISTRLYLIYSGISAEEIENSK